MIWWLLGIGVAFIVGVACGFGAGVDAVRRDAQRWVNRVQEPTDVVKSYEAWFSPENAELREKFKRVHPLGKYV